MPGDWEDEVRQLLKTPAEAASEARRLLAENERARQQIERGLTEEKEKLKRWESRLPNLTNARESAALQREIESMKARLPTLEEQLAQLTLAAEPLRISAKEKESALAASEAVRLHAEEAAKEEESQRKRVALELERMRAETFGKLKQLNDLLKGRAVMEPSVETTGNGMKMIVSVHDESVGVEFDQAAGSLTIHNGGARERFVREQSGVWKESRGSSFSASYFEELLKAFAQRVKRR